MRLEELREFFKSAKLPGKVRLDSGQTVTNVAKLIKSHIATLEAHPGNRKKLGYWDRLMKVKEATDEQVRV